MIAAQTKEGTRVDEFIYTPRRVAYLIRHFSEIRSMADGGAAARGLLLPGPTPETPRFGKRQFFGSNSCSHVIADIERAIDKALTDSLEWRVVVAVAQRRWSIGKFAEQSNIATEKAQMAFESATVRMAVFLGWVPEDALHD